MQKYRYHSRDKEEPNATYNKFYFEFINESKAFLLIYNSDIIKSYEWTINRRQANFSPGWY